MTKPFEPLTLGFIRAGLNIAQFINFAVKNLPIPYNLSQGYSWENVQCIVLCAFERDHNSEKYIYIFYIRA